MGRALLSLTKVPAKSMTMKVMNTQRALQNIVLNDPLQMQALFAVQALQLNDGWIGAGFVRDARRGAECSKRKSD